MDLRIQHTAEAVSLRERMTLRWRLEYWSLGSVSRSSPGVSYQNVMTHKQMICHFYCVKGFNVKKKIYIEAHLKKRTYLPAGHMSFKYMSQQRLSDFRGVIVAKLFANVIGELSNCTRIIRLSEWSTVSKCIWICTAVCKCVITLSVYDCTHRHHVDSVATQPYSPAVSARRPLVWQPVTMQKSPPMSLFPLCIGRARLVGTDGASWVHWNAPALLSKEFYMIVGCAQSWMHTEELTNVRLYTEQRNMRTRR